MSIWVRNREFFAERKSRAPAFIDSRAVHTRKAAAGLPHSRMGNNPWS